MPLNERVEAFVVKHTELIEEDEMSTCLLELCGHVEACRGVIAQWNASDSSRHTAAQNYPPRCSITRAATTRGSKASKRPPSELAPS